MKQIITGVFLLVTGVIGSSAPCQAYPPFPIPGSPTNPVANAFAYPPFPIPGSPTNPVANAF